MMRPKMMWAGAALSILTVGGLVSLYQLMFAVWMTAYPFVNTNEWRRWFYIWLVTTVVIGLLWGTLAGWLFRHRKLTPDTRHSPTTGG
jgi:ABC-type xylose transport system permease subunit